MSWKHDCEMTLSDGREVIVDYVFESYGSEPSGQSGPPENYDPGEGPEFYIERVRLAADGSSDEPIELSEEERERIEAQILDNPDWWAPSPYDDWED